MNVFKTQNAEDGCELQGYSCTPEKKSKAVMSLVHGFGEHCYRYQSMAAYLNQQGIAVVTLDLRGHGRSGGKRGVCRNYGLLHGDMEALLNQTRAEFPGLPHIVYGHSMGGGLVLNYMLTHMPNDITAVIASAPLLGLSDPLSRPLEWLVRGLEKVAPNMTLKNSIDGTKISTLEQEQSLYMSDPLIQGRLGVGLAIGMVEAGRYSLKNAQRWTLPLLLMHAREDRLTAFAESETFASRAPNCTFLPFETVAHEMHNDTSRDAVYGAMETFVKSHL